MSFSDYPASSYSWQRRYWFNYTETGTSSLPSMLRDRRGRAPSVSNPKIGGWRSPSSHYAWDIQMRASPGSYRCGTSSSTIWSFSSPRNFSSVIGSSVGLYKIQSMPNGTYLPSVSSNTIARAQTQALAKANRRQMDLGVAIAESREAATMVTRRLARILDALRLIRRGDMARAWQLYAVRARTVGHAGRQTGRQRSFADSVSNLWLEYSFGWKPLIGDLKDALSLLSDRLDRRQIVTCKSLVVKGLLPPSYFTNLRNEVRGSPTFSGSESAFVRLDFEVKLQKSQDLKQLGLLNPLEIGWELIPFSFLLDYLIPVGTFLQALGGAVGLDPIGRSQTLRVEHEGRFEQIVNTAASSPIFIDGSGSIVTWRSFAYQRMIPAIIVPSLYYRSPFTNKTRVANVTALIHQLSKL